jgi:hypothetical protein
MNIDYSVYLVTNREVTEKHGRDFFAAQSQMPKALFR